MTRFARSSLIALIFALPSPALAAPGLGMEVYAAEVEAGEAEAEVHYAALTGGPDDGEDVLKFEAAWSASDRLRIGVTSEFEKEPGLPRKAEALGFEAIYELGKIGPVTVAAYGEYEVMLNGPDKIETKLLLQHRSGPVDLRFNLIGEKSLQSGEKFELEYALQADIEVADEFRLGVQAFGELGTFDRLFPNTEHFVGPIASLEIEGLGPELELQTGYLFALGTARQDTKGQFRLSLELEF
jgi:hypothetical protein